jgi:hypothetical protein
MKRLITKHSIDALPILSPAEPIVARAERKILTTFVIPITENARKRMMLRIFNEPTHWLRRGSVEQEHILSFVEEPLSQGL